MLTKQTANLRPVVGFTLLGLFVLYGWTLASIFEEREWPSGYEDNTLVQVSEMRTCIEAFIYAAIFLPVLIYQVGKFMQAQIDAIELMNLI